MERRMKAAEVRRVAVVVDVGRVRVRGRGAGG